MVALVTGASSGIGKDIAKYLSELGYDLIIVARKEGELQKLRAELNTQVDVIPMDLGIHENCINLYEQVKEKYGNIDILVNNAGFGTFGEFTETELQTEMDMINLNISAVHTLMKLFLRDMKKINKGHILNVASISGFMPGPLMSTYYATKGYVVRLSQGIHEELRKAKSNVSISVLCPGPVDTNFNDVAKVQFSMKSLTSEYVAKYAVTKMLKKKLIILPGTTIKAIRVLAKIVPDKILAKVCFRVQFSKRR